MSEFMKLTPAARARRIEATRVLIHRLGRENGHPPVEDKQLSTTAAAWLRRLQEALVTETCSDRDYMALDASAVASVAAEEQPELLRRLINFVALRDVMPGDSTSAKQAIRPVVQALGDRVGSQA